ncbi:hypothetical protein P8S54_06590 [Thiomicrospira sp. R3]|uniref:hypothetical protein n=1 Tax=Thiomicrospira sp. R3 TaxID=3035472 RepID=UPI00259BCD59|nr:hypothetical protein [Thiomicrospira sp. R3]WFE67897.1 hypothetical protein P8S54_06590 [Thiomicrospira sp. R3]
MTSMQHRAANDYDYNYDYNYNLSLSSYVEAEDTRKTIELTQLNAELMAKVKDLPTRRWYMQAVVNNGWIRNTLVMQIESAAHQRQGRAISNLASRLPAPDSDLVQQTLKDPYLFDFLSLELGFHERELEIGPILCQQPNRVLAEYALCGVDKLIGVSSYELTRALPEALETSLPSIEQIERELQAAESEEGKA